jgi:hypothetical protein
VGATRPAKSCTARLHILHFPPLQLSLSLGSIHLASSRLSITSLSSLILYLRGFCHARPKSVEESDSRQSNPLYAVCNAMFILPRLQESPIFYRLFTPVFEAVLPVGNIGCRCLRRSVDTVSQEDRSGVDETEQLHRKNLKHIYRSTWRDWDPWFIAVAHYAVFSLCCDHQ